MAFMRWLNQFLRPYLRDRLRPLLDEAAEAAVAPHAAASIKGLGGHHAALKGATASATARLSFPASAAAAAGPKHAQHTAGTAPLRPHGTADAALVQQAQATVLTASTAAALQAATARRRSGGKQQQQQPAAAATPSQPQQQARHQQAAQAQGQPRSVPINEGASSASTKADAAGASANHHHHEQQQQQQQQQQRFRRCYYVPVMNPLPDLKDKQLAVLDMRLYGIRDMPSLQERLPTLPPSVLTTARLRGLPLFEVKDLVQELERSVLSEGGQGQQQTVLAAAEAFDVEEEDEEDDDDEEDEEPRLRTDSKSC